MKLVAEDENWLYFEGEIEVDGKKYIQRLTQCKLREGTNVPKHVNRVRFNKEDSHGRYVGHANGSRQKE